MKIRSIWIHIGLFVLTIITTTIAGAEWMFGKYVFWGEERTSWDDLIQAFNFSVPFLLILTFHEFGHYFTARYHKIKTTLPFYIPFWLGFVLMPSFGTMGAFIKIKSIIHSRKEYFDVGVSGPLAGFVIALVVIWYGFTYLPEADYIFQIHPEYEEYGLDYADHVYQDSENTISFKFGNNLIYWWFQNYYVTDKSRLPHPNEIIHYPYLLAGYLALFFTALNLLPIGQLDGGHVLFSLFGQKKSIWINRITFTLFVFYAGLGWINDSMLQDLSTGSSLSFLLLVGVYIYFLYVVASGMLQQNRDRFMFAGILFSLQYVISDIFEFEGYPGWLLFSFIIGRFLGVYHPRVSDNRPLNPARKILAWMAILVFILSFSPRPFIVE
jgi:membrane-associated protease RseP (regulator of RpoE activity)